MPACAYTSAAQSTAPCGRTGSRPGNDDGSDRTADPRIHAGWRPSASAASPPAWSVNTTAHAPSDDGHDSRNRTGSHIIGDAFTVSSEMSFSCRCAYGFFSAFSRSFTATIGPMSAGAPVRYMYERMYGANAPPAPIDAPLPEPSANCALPSDCFSQRDREHALVPAGLDVVGGDDAGGAADRTGGVHAEHRLARRRRARR